MDPIHLETGETSQLNFFSQQLREIETELQKHAAAREVLAGQAEKYMLTLRDKYGLNGQPIIRLGKRAIDCSGDNRRSGS